jgi:pyrroline-5-carboxylate reductase
VVRRVFAREVAVSEPGIGFVVGGRIVRIMLAGWRRAGRPLPRVVVSDTDATVLERLRAEFPFITATGDNRDAAKLATVFLALHPPAVAGALAEIKDSLPADAVLVSLAPKWTAGKIGEALGGFSRLARVIPNAPSIVNKGYNPVCFSMSLAASDRARVLALFAPLGACPEVPEEMLEAYAIVAAMGPTYLWYQLYQLVDLGCQFGLDRESAAAAVSAMLDGTRATMADAGLTPEGVMDLIPVKPLAPIESTVREAYGQTLTELYKKLKG